MKNKIFVILLLIIVIFLVIYFFYKEDKNEEQEELVVKEETLNIDDDGDTILKSNLNSSISNIHIDIKGEIKNPGVYEVEENVRVIDVIELSGGLTKNANTNYINLSEKVTDEMVIWIYSNEEIEELLLDKNSTKYMINECNCPVVDNTTCLNSENPKTNGEYSKININSATIDELSKLDGIGETKAKSIVEYREKNGNFNSIEDIMKVSGIGESAYSKIKDYIEI